MPIIYNTQQSRPLSSFTRMRTAFFSPLWRRCAVYSAVAKPQSEVILGGAAVAVRQLKSKFHASEVVLSCIGGVPFQLEYILIIVSIYIPRYIHNRLSGIWFGFWTNVRVGIKWIYLVSMRYRKNSPDAPDELLLSALSNSFCIISNGRWAWHLLPLRGVDDVFFKLWCICIPSLWLWRFVPILIYRKVLFAKEILFREYMLWFFFSNSVTSPKIFTTFHASTYRLLTSITPSSWYMIHLSRGGISNKGATSPKKIKKHTIDSRLLRDSHEYLYYIVAPYED